VWAHLELVAKQMVDPYDFNANEGPQLLPWVLLKKEKYSFSLVKTLGDPDARDLWDVRGKGRTTSDEITIFLGKPSLTQCSTYFL
jgi:hypothetical protein